MPDQPTILNFISEWWKFIFFVLGAILTFMLGKERQRYKVDQIGKEVCALKEEVKEIRKELSDMHTQDGEGAIETARSMTELSVDIKYLRKAMDEMKTQIQHKVDR